MLTRSLTAALALATLTAPAVAQEVPPFVSDIAAGRIVAISDGDFVAATYADGSLAPAEAGFSDVLTVLTLTEGGPVSGSLPVSNSVTAAPEILALSPDGRTAFVAERLRQRPAGATKASELAAGRRLFAVDLSDPRRPAMADTAEVSPHPEALSVSPDGRFVAVVGNTDAGVRLDIVPFVDGKFGEGTQFGAAALSLPTQGSVPKASNVHWHPSGDALAVNLNTRDAVAFYRVDWAGGVALTPWGAPVEVGPDPFVGRFTPDGRHYLTSNWGRSFAATSLDDRLPDAPSTVSVIRLADSTDDDAAHRAMPPVATDESAEGLAISPDGRLVATVNMRGTILGGARFDREATISLLALDPSTGGLVKLGDTAFEGRLPEGGRFDLAGAYFLATVFEGHDGSMGPGLEVFRVVGGEAPRLERVGRIPMPHGVHHVDIAP